jgi:hypothetical protein
MKKALLITVALALSVIASQAQGLVSISLTGGILASTNGAAIGLGTGKLFGTGTAGYYFELLYSGNLAASTAGDVTLTGNLAQWMDSGVFGSSQSALSAGKINSGSSVAANGWTVPAGATYDNERAVDVIGWSGNYGTTYAQFLNSLSLSLATVGPGYYGFATGLNYAGGGSFDLPAVEMWVNMTAQPGVGLSNGIVLYAVMPEPGTLALAGLGGLSLLAFRRKK